MQEWYPQANNITLSKYAFELPEIFDHKAVKDRFSTWSMGLFGHSPDTANEWDFWPVKWGEKKSTATMFGYDGSCQCSFPPPSSIVVMRALISSLPHTHIRVRQGAKR